MQCRPICSANVATPLPDGPPPFDPPTGGGASALSCCGHEWQFNAATSEPPTGQSIRLNHSDKTLATKLWITKVNSSTDNVGAYLATNMLVGRRLYFKELDDSDTNAIYTVSGPVIDKGTYYEVPVAFAMSLPNQRVSLTILP